MNDREYQFWLALRRGLLTMVEAFKNLPPAEVEGPERIRRAFRRAIWEIEEHIGVPTEKRKGLEP